MAEKNTAATGKKQKRMNQWDGWRITAAIFTGVFGIICLYPFLLTLAGSFTTSYDAVTYGFHVIPHTISLNTYKTLFINGKTVVNGYKITLFTTIVGTILSLTVNTMMGFVLSRKNMRFRGFLNFYVLFTMLFSGGMVPWYIICVNILHIKDTIWALIVPMMVGAWNIFLIRNYFNSIPEEMYESARVDGASDFCIFYKIYIRLATPVIATVTLFTALGYWNDWWLGLMLIDNTDLQPLQMMLRNMMSNLTFLMSNQSSPEAQKLLATVPQDSMKMALVIVTTGPILILYPFLQRYFVKGIMVGAVKG